MSKETHINIPNSSSFEMRCGAVIAIFAALMAITDLLAGKYDADEIIGTNDKAMAYSWYQSKSIKETLVQGEISLLKSLKEANAIQKSAIIGVDNHLADLAKKSVQYKKEKDEILRGSKTVGQENWVQDVNGEYGRVIGANEIEAQLAILSTAGDRFDIAILLYQVCLVLGAVSLVLRKPSLQTIFFRGMWLLGLIGSGMSFWAFSFIQNSLA
ncbi:MAG: DUF4337 domain-containing protein [Methylococcaceae bacterium]